MMLERHIKSYKTGKTKKGRNCRKTKSGKWSLARCRVLCEVGDCFGRETVRAKEEVEEEEERRGEGGLQGQREAGQVYRVSVSAGHDHSSMPIATRREQTE